MPAVAIALSAILFSLFHLSLVQAVPTLLLGLVYGYLALAARSLLRAANSSCASRGIDADWA